MTNGRFGRMTVRQARSEALQNFAEIEGGEDPVEERREGSASTVDDLVDMYIEKHAKPRRKTWEEDKRRHAATRPT